MGNLIQDSRFTYTYDAFGRLTDVTGRGQSIEYAYNARHQRVRKTVNGKNTHFQYDDSGRLLVEQDHSGAVVRQYIYLGMRPIGQLGNGAVLTSGASQTINLSGVNKTDSNDVASATITLGDKPRLKLVTNQIGTVTNFGTFKVKKVGSKKRIRFTHRKGKQKARISLTIDPASPRNSQGTITYQSRIRYSKKFDYPVRYVGNKLTVGATDGSAAKITFNSNNTMTLEYDGRKTTFTPNRRYGHSASAVFEHYERGFSVKGFASGGFGEIEINENRTLKAAYRLRGIVNHAAGAGGELPLHTLHTDHLATVHAITDSAQNIIWQGEHDAFGQTYPTIGTIDNPLRFPGQYFDAETGLHYNWHRYYNPATGRYISSDPIGLAGGLNTFGYAGQSPGNYIDPKGLFWESLSPAAYHEAGQFTDFLLNHSDEINNVFWDFFAQDFIDSANDFHDGHYAGAVFSAVCGIAKPLKVVKGTKLGSYRPDRALPRDEHGNPVPDTNAPHTQLGTKKGRKRDYTQAREFDANGKPVRDIDFTDHDRPQNHPNPHQHRYVPNETGGTLRRLKDAEPL